MARLTSKEKRDMQKLINLLVQTPLSGRQPVVELDGQTPIEAYKTANVDIGTRILLQQALDAMKGDRQAAEFIFKYGGFEPPKEQHITVETPTIVDDMGPKAEEKSAAGEEKEPYIPETVYNDPEESED